MTDKITVGVIGLGVGEAHARGFQACSDAELAAVCDANPERLRAVGDRLGVAREKQFTRVDELLARPDLDAVSVTLPNVLHAPVAIAALQAGKHVLCEKPLARTAPEAQTIVEAAKATGRTLMVCFNYRYRADARWVKALEAEGKLGRVYFAKAGWLRNRGIPGAGTWFTRKEQSGGGPLIDLGVHVLDLTLWLMGYPRPASVSGMTFAEFGPRGQKGFAGRWQTSSELAFDVEDLAAGFVRFENGAALCLETNWASHTKAGRDDYFVTLYGTEGGAELYVPNYADRDTVSYFTEAGETPVEVRPALRSQNSHALAAAHFVECLRQGRAPESTGEQGVALLKVIDALYESARTGREVRLE